MISSYQSNGPEGTHWLLGRRSANKKQIEIIEKNNFKAGLILAPSSAIYRFFYFE